MADDRDRPTGRRARRGQGHQRPAAGPRGRADPVRAVPPGPTGLVVPHHRHPRDARRGAGPRRAPPARRAGAAGRGVRAGPGGPLHPAVAPAVLRRPRGLSARLVHHEVQPQGVRHRGRPARSGRGPPGGAGLAHPGLARRCWSSWRRPCARSPAWPRPPCSRRRRRRRADRAAAHAGLARGPGVGPATR